jgi:hypothetical protein
MDPQPHTDRQPPDIPRSPPLTARRGLARGCLGGLVVFLLGGLLILVLAEAAVRIFLPAPPLLGRYDPVLGVSLRPGSRGWWPGEHPVYVAINSLGHRDRERGWRREASGDWFKPAGTRRVLLLGDSLVLGLGVELTRTFGQIFERDLQARGRWRQFNWEVINAGLPDTGVSHHYLLLQDRGFRYRPDVVILFVTPPRGLLADSPEFGRTERPRVTVVNGRLEVDRGFPERGLNRLRRSWWGRFLYLITPESHLLRWLNHEKYDVLDLYRRVFRPDSGEGFLGLRREVGRRAAADSFYLNLRPFTWAGWQFAQMPLAYLEHLAFAERVWRVVARVLIEMNRLCAARGVKFLVVLVPRPEQVDQVLRSGWQADNPALDLNLVEDRLTAVCRAHRIPVFSLTAGIIRLTRDRGAGLFRAEPGRAAADEELNERGHEAVAGLLLGFLRDHHPDWIRPPK